MVLDLVARQALLVYQDQALVREDEEVPDQLVGLLDSLAPREHPGKVTLYLGRIYLRRVPHQSVEQSHASSYLVVVEFTRPLAARTGPSSAASRGSPDPRGEHALQRKAQRPHRQPPAGPAGGAGAGGPARPPRRARPAAEGATTEAPATRRPCRRRGRR